MKVERIAENSPLGEFCSTFDLHYAIIFFFEWLLKTGFTV